MEKEFKELGEAVKLIRKQLIRGMMSEMGFWGRMKFGLYLLYLRIARLWQ